MLVLKSGRTWVRLITEPADRKSTRLNSSHSQISYAVFCLKKKKINSNQRTIGFLCSQTRMWAFRVRLASRYRDIALTHHPNHCEPQLICTCPADSLVGAH